MNIYAWVHYICPYSKNFSFTCIIGMALYNLIVCTNNAVIQNTYTCKCTKSHADLLMHLRLHAEVKKFVWPDQ